MEASETKLGRASAAFALSAAAVILFNTFLACAKDAYSPLKNFMASLSGHDWTTQGIADVVLFVLFGVILTNARVTDRMSSKSLISFLVAAVLIAGVGLFAWYALY